ncbi:hypothetical protein KCU93_g142, partial [Aureobasidium melanogenum]
MRLLGSTRFQYTDLPVDQARRSFASSSDTAGLSSLLRFGSLDTERRTRYESDQTVGQRRDVGLFKGWITASSSTHVVSAVYETGRSLVQSRTTKGSVRLDWFATSKRTQQAGPEERGVQGHESRSHWASQRWPDPPTSSWRSPRRTSVGGMADKANTSTAIDWTRASLLSMLAIEGGLGGARRLDVWLLNRRGGLCVHKTVVRVNVREGMTEPATSGSVGRSLGALFDLVVVLGRSGFCSKSVFGEGQIPLRSLRRSLLSRCGEHNTQVSRSKNNPIRVGSHMSSSTSMASGLAAGCTTGGALLPPSGPLLAATKPVGARAWRSKAAIASVFCVVSSRCPSSAGAC